MGDETTGAKKRERPTLRDCKIWAKDVCVRQPISLELNYDEDNNIKCPQIPDSWKDEAEGKNREPEGDREAKGGAYPSERGTHCAREPQEVNA